MADADAAPIAGSPSRSSPASSRFSPREPRQPSVRTRSFAGCQTCRQKKVKCDEVRPRCGRCDRLSIECDYTRLPRKKHVRRAAQPTPAAMVVTAPTPACERQNETSTPEVSHTIFSAESPYPVVAQQREGDSCSLDGWAISESAYSGPYPCSGSPNSDISSSIGELSPECLRILLPSDHSAIRFFCSFFAAEGDSKVPEYSGPAIVWMLARNSPMVLHLVCAMGGQKWCAMHPGSPDAHAMRMQAIEHYGAGLRLVLDIAQDSNGSTNLDCILATSWLMILYELKFGDGCGVGLSTHIKGVASMLQSRLRPAHLEFDRADQWTDDGTEDAAVHIRLSTAPESERLSPVSCKIIVWMALLDGGAALGGFGGAFNELLGQLIPGLLENPVRSRLECLRAVQQRAGLVNDQIWGRSYPQHHLIDDMQNNQLTCLYAESGQLRFLLGNLAAAEHRLSGPPDELLRKSIARGIRSVGARYHEMIHIASRLELPEDGLQKQFVVMLRFIVSFYHAVSLCFLRIVHGDAPLMLEQRKALNQIMSLSFKAFRDQGEVGMTRLSWPLWIAALESDDIVHRTWILERYEELAKRGENHRRALEALRVAFGGQEMDERRISYWELLRQDGVGCFLI